MAAGETCDILYATNGVYGSRRSYHKATLRGINELPCGSFIPREDSHKSLKGGFVSIEEEYGIVYKHGV